MGKAWEHLSCECLAVAMWMCGGKGPQSNNILDFIIEHSNNNQDPRHSRNRQSISKKLALWFIAHEIVDGHRPSYVRLVSQVFPIFHYSSAFMY